MNKQRRHLLPRQYQTIEMKPRSILPGPGDYDISLPIVKPNYEAIQKNDDIIIVKVNHQGESANFKPGLTRFPLQKQKSPGPGFYKKANDQKIKRKVVQKKYSQRYSDLVQFMYENKSRIPPIPDYRVLYDDERETTLKQIKNSYKRFRKKSIALSMENHESTRKFKNSPTKSIISINSSRVAAYEDLNDETNYYMDILAERKQSDEDSKRSRTLDYPQPIKQITYKARHLKKQDDLLLHKATLYNRNMVGMLISKNSKKITSNKK